MLGLPQLKEIVVIVAVKKFPLEDGVVSFFE
jgi:hypothetical protein